MLKVLQHRDNPALVERFVYLAHYIEDNSVVGVFATHEAAVRAVKRTARRIKASKLSKHPRANILNYDIVEREVKNA
jgi:hypothetical protein